MVREEAKYSENAVIRKFNKSKEVSWLGRVLHP
jgi:hypothetical protein